MSQTRGKFITFEGGEGTGKSTQARLLRDALAQRGLHVILTREPGGSTGAEQIRSLLVEGDPGRWDPMCEALLLFAARRSHLREIIIPALDRGDWVICDRFSDSTFAYQGGAHGLGFAAMQNLASIALDSDSPIPDLTLILDIAVQDGLARAKTRGGSEDRFEKLGTAFHQRLRDSFIEIAGINPQRCVLIDALPAPGLVAAKIASVLAGKFNL